MIIKGGKKVSHVYRGHKKVAQIIIGGNCVYTSSGGNKYLYTDKQTIWLDPSDVFNIYSNVDWVIYKDGEAPFINVSKDTLWLNPTDYFDITTNSNWIII